MWGEFFACMAIIVLALYGPGVLAFRALRLDGSLALACAPLASIFGYSIVALIYDKLDAPCSWATTILPLVAVYGATYIISHLMTGRQQGSDSKLSWLLLGAYLIVGLAVCGYVFIKSLDGPLSYYCRFDNQTHYALARHFIDTQNWSTLDTWSGALSETSRTGYYPAAWHATAALACSLTGFDPALVFNALNATLSGIVFPASSYALMHVLFPNRKSVLAAGAVTTMAFACLPWVLLLKGQLLANLISFAITPAAIALIIRYAEDGLARHWPAFAIVAVMSLGDFVFAHPNGLFTAVVFLTPYFIHRAALACKNSKRLSERNPLRRPWVVWAAGASIAFALWQAMLYAPPLQAVVLYNNTGNLNLTWGESVWAALGLSLYPDQPMQWLAMAFCLIGAVSLVRQKRLWLALPGLWMLVVYAACRCTEASYTLRTFLAGFWYSDPYRILCCAELFLIPVAAAGLVAAARWLTRQLPIAGAHPRTTQLLVLTMFSLGNFFPYYVAPPKPDAAEPEPHFVPTAGTAFGFMHYLMTEGYTEAEEQAYSAEERDFVERARNALPADALVINQPHDGSTFAYGLDGLNTYYRHIDVGSDTPDSQLLRSSLDAIATNAEVQEAARKAGVGYVLQLDQGADPSKIDDPESTDGRTWLLQSDESSWRNFDGINRITDETPGFELVMSKGDMRLYRIL